MDSYGDREYTNFLVYFICIFNFVLFFTGVVLHIYFSTCHFDDSTRFAWNCDQVRYTQFFCRRFDFEYIHAFFRHWCQCYFILSSTSTNPFQNSPLFLPLYLKCMDELGWASLQPLFACPFLNDVFNPQILHIGNLITIGLNLGCAFAPTTGALIAFRFLCM